MMYILHSDERTTTYFANFVKLLDKEIYANSNNHYLKHIQVAVKIHATRISIKLLGLQNT
jgi:hypothetical protein